MDMDRFLRLDDFVGRDRAVPVSRAHWYALMQEGKAPRPVKLGKAAAWRQSEINRFIAGEWKPEEEAA